MSTDAIQQLKQNFTASGVHSIVCENCNSPNYTLKDYSESDILVIAHLECPNCKSKCDFAMFPQPNGVVTGIKTLNSN
jgi:hypothetical protein